MSTWGHHARRLTADEIDRYDRFGDVCGAAPKCQLLATCQISYEYRTGQRGRITISNRRACDGHAGKFAAKHGITIADAPDTEPASMGIIATAAAAWPAPPTELVTVRRCGNQWMTTFYSLRGMTAGTGWLPSLPADVALAEITQHTETMLAADHRLVPLGPWQLTGDGRARVPVAKAEDVDAWAHHRWAVTVHLDGSYRPMWVATAMLGPAFKVRTWALGHTNMDRDRALRTTPGEMGPSWTLGEWTRTGDTASTTATYRSVA